MPESAPLLRSASGQVILPPKRRPQRQKLSCRPCREHKLKCDREIPCGSCCRNDRRETCCRFPATQSKTALAKARGQSTAAVQSETGQGEAPSHQKGSDRQPHQHQPHKQLYQHAPEQELRHEQTSVGGLAPEWGVDETTAEQMAYLSPLSVGKPASAATDVSKASPAAPVTVRDFTTSLETHLHLNTRARPERDGEQRGSERAAGQISMAAASDDHVAASSSRLSTPTTTSYGGSSSWCYRLIRNLPGQSQCDALVSFFLENINCCYQVIHAPTFQQAYSGLWATEIGKVDLIWLSLLYAVLSASILVLPEELRDMFGIDAKPTGRLAKSWYMASRQCLVAGEAEAKPSFVQLQTFLTLQLYWLAVEDVETLNSCLGQSVRAAQSIGLDTDISPATSVEQEMRHRVWWELCCTDTFQSICLNRTPLVQSRYSPVPFPTNCNDADLASARMTSRPASVPTQATFSIMRAQATRVLNELFDAPIPRQPSYETVKAVDARLLDVIAQCSWYHYFCESSNDGAGERARFFAALPRALASLPWQAHLFHTFICVQRLRLYRPFLDIGDADATRTTLEAATSPFDVYRTIRAQYAENPALARFRFASDAYQLFSTAISLALFLVKERPSDSAASRIRADVDMVITDLEYLTERGLTVPVAIHGAQTLRHILSLHDAGCSDDDLVQFSLMPSVHSVIGGMDTTRQYLESRRYSSSFLPSMPDQDFLFLGMDDWDLTTLVSTGIDSLHSFGSSATEHVNQSDILFPNS